MIIGREATITITVDGKPLTRIGAMTMTTRDTSREAYAQLVESGAIKGNQAKILQAVIGGPDRTSGEICAALGIDNVNAWRARFTELQGRGLIVESGTRPCKITGRTALTWQYSGRTKPLEVKHRASAKLLRQLVIDAIAIIGPGPGPRGLENAVARLRERAKAAGL